MTLDLQRLIPSAEAAGLTNEVGRLHEWMREIQGFLRVLDAPVEQYALETLPAERVHRAFARIEDTAILDRIRSTVSAMFPVSTPERTAWDYLTSLEALLKTLASAEKREALAARLADQASSILRHFESARDQVLQSLYDSIRDRFVELYRALHASDESSFTSFLGPDGAALKFEVDFYNRGMHPPHALHSEGHQDSMGLCLYLALIERLAGNRIDLTVLDDVVMSIDQGHRRELCRLLRTQFPDRQFLITTHDEQWARQLRAESVVTRQQCIGLAGWTVETGPRYSYEADLWLRIEALLTQGDVPTAAFHLRRGSEAFYHDACAALQASIRFRSDGGWDLGELYSAASSRLNDLLGKADRAAQSWGKPVPPLVPTNLGILKRAVEANWQDVNGSIHYNRWGELSVQDFRPVVTAFKDLHDAFTCPSCQGQLYVTGVGIKHDLLRCPCGMITLNLEKNPSPVRQSEPKAAQPAASGEAEKPSS